MLSNQHIEVVQKQNAESTSMVFKYFSRLREDKGVSANHLSQIYKIAQASAVLRYFSLSII